MKKLKDSILELLKSGSSGQYDLKSIGSILKIESTADFIMLNKALNELEDDFIVVRNKNNKYLLAKQAMVYRGIISINSKGKGFLDLDDYSIVIPKEYLNGALNNDEVIVKLQNKKIYDLGYVEKVVKRNTSKVVGTISIIKKTISVALDDDKFNIYDLKIINANKFKLVDGLKAQFHIKEYPYGKTRTNLPVMKLEIEKIIGHKDDPGVDILSILLNYDINLEFNEAALNQAETIPLEVTMSQRENRKDLTDLFVVSIDGDEAKDFDDAISIEKIPEGYELGVHIADVSYYVKANTPLDIEARTRGTSTYLVDRVVPMLPHILSNGICSLIPNVERLAISCIMKIDNNGEVIDYELFESIIKSKQRMTYNNVNKIYSGDKFVNNKYKDISYKFYLMKDCAQVIRKRRNKAGSIDFDKEEAIIKVDKNGKPIDIIKRELGEAENIIEDFMICTNECVAKHLKYLSVPTLYRIHEVPKVKKIEEFKRVSSIMGHTFRVKGSSLRPLDIQKYLDGLKEEDDYTVISTLMLRSMQKARYDAKPVGHFGLALNDYLHFTSPIRRYPDLIVHRMLRKYCFNNNFNEIENDEKLMNEFAIITSERERASIDAERDVDSMKMAEYMQDHIGKVYEGIISSITNFGFFVELDNLVEGLVHIHTLKDDYYNFDELTLSLVGERNRKRFKLGQKVKIRVTGANKLARTIDFELYKNVSRTRVKYSNNKEKKAKKKNSKLSRWR